MNLQVRCSQTQERSDSWLLLAGALGPHPLLRILLLLGGVGEFRAPAIWALESSGFLGFEVGFVPSPGWSLAMRGTLLSFW